MARKTKVGEPVVESAEQLPGAEEVAARTAPDAPADGLFRHTFTLSPRDGRENTDNDDMHRANEVATLQYALNKGVHPKGEAFLEGISTREDGSVDFTYAVEAIPASEDDAPGQSQVPAKAIREMGGSTTESAQDSIAHGTSKAAAKDDGGVTA